MSEETQATQTEQQKTAQAHRLNGPMPRVYRRYLTAHHVAGLKTRVLDFGCGKAEAYTKMLLQQGVDAVGYDYDYAPMPPAMTEVGTVGPYAYILVSNVLNVHESDHTLKATIAQVAAIAEWCNATVIVNYPDEPRRLSDDCGYEVDAEFIESLLLMKFRIVAVEPYGRDARMWVLRAK